MLRPLAFALAAAVCGAAYAVPASARGLSDADKSFIAKDDQGAHYELALAQQAQQMATRADVRAYAQKVAEDHVAYNAALERLAFSHDAVLPPDMAQDDKDRLTKMGGLSGPAYDSAFIQEAIRINAQDQQDEKQEQDSTKSSAIKAFLHRFRGMDERHEAAAEALQKQSF